MAQSNDGSEEMRKWLLSAIEGTQSHIDFDSAIADFPPELRGAKPHGAPHSAWELLEHMRIAQRDILDFSRDAGDYQELRWPEDYWPTNSAPPDEYAWDRSVEAFQADRKQMETLIKDEEHDLWKRFRHGNGQNLVREALVLANHNSYHLGQIVFLKRMLTAQRSVGAA